MDLKEFTKQTIVQIVEGAIEANATINGHNAHVHIRIDNGEFGTSYPITNVDFDVAITATESEGSNGGGGIKVAELLNIGGKIENRTENQTVSRIKFTIPIVLGSK